MFACLRAASILCPGVIRFSPIKKTTGMKFRWLEDKNYNRL